MEYSKRKGNQLGGLIMETYLIITPYDPIIARDGRPFGFGQRRMHSLNWPYPSVLAGSLRTIIGKEMGTDFRERKFLEDLKRITISGPLPMCSDKLFFPAPKDLIVREEGNKRDAFAIRPMKLNKTTDDSGEGCDPPKRDLLPAMLPMDIEDFKPAPVPSFWSAEMMIQWLKNPFGRDFQAPPDPEKANSHTDFLPSIPKDSRVHVKISPELGSVDESDGEGMLFMTVGLDLSQKEKPQGIKLAARCEAEKILGDKMQNINSFGTFGGERRLAHWKTEAHDMMQKIWSFPEEIKKALEDQKEKTGRQLLRMILVTPAIFSEGWLPGWINCHGGSLVGSPSLENRANMELRLISASMDRWKPISGWSLERPRPGPKPIRRLVPAGSVYFFEVLSGDAEDIVKKLWLRSVCDDDQDRRDGFGLAIWGIWDYAD